MDLTVTHHVHELDGDVLGTYVGGANDVASATAIACAAYTAMQAAAGSTSRIVAVVDDTGTVLAWIGKSPEQQGLGPEAD